MAIFDFFFFPPYHTFRLADSRNWFALAVYLVTAVVVSELATRSRRQARESALLTEIATSLLERGGVSGGLERIGAEAARVLQVEQARIELGGASAPVDGAAERHPLAVGGRRVGTIYLERPRQGGASARRRLLPALASLLGVAIDRERLAREALEAEALRRSDSIKTAVIQAVSHDLRTPLATIEAALDGLESRSLDLEEQDRAALLETIRLEHGRLKRLVENLLDLSRLQAGAAPPTLELWTADDLLARALGEIGEPERVVLHAPADLPPARVDAVQIQRVLVNLLENALKFSPGQERVLVRVTAARGELVVRVVDRGPGVSEAERERIFEPFYRAGVHDQRGAGLGLAIARGFAEANGGRVWVESRVGQGASFALALPAAELPARVSV
jgi:two-component system sensor histidine kinase KdpD